MEILRRLVYFWWWLRGGWQWRNMRWILGLDLLLDCNIWLVCRINLGHNILVECFCLKVKVCLGRGLRSIFIWSSGLRRSVRVMRRYLSCRRCCRLLGLRQRVRIWLRGRRWRQWRSYYRSNRRSYYLSNRRGYWVEINILLILKRWWFWLKRSVREYTFFKLNMVWKIHTIISMIIADVSTLSRRVSE